MYTCQILSVFVMNPPNLISQILVLLEESKMADGIQLRDIRTTTTNLPPPAYASYENPAFGTGDFYYL